MVADVENLVHCGLCQLADVERSRGTPDHDSAIESLDGQFANTTTRAFGDPLGKALVEINE